MADDEDNSMKKISGIVDFDRQTVSNVIKNHISGDRLCRQMKKEVIP